ncbi:hypothetical protein ACFYY1_29835 [Streptomyces sp. NPDC001890]|uniref:hypothetical protein n=1 Tax=Streptomyces sp. NPDC001890 TaxID=3364620 RepID=UPI0036C84BF9
MSPVPFDLDPTRMPLMVLRRPDNQHFSQMPFGAFESDARPVLARNVQAGDLIVAAFTEHPTPYQLTRATAWIPDPYPAAAPAPWDPACTCEECGTVHRLLGPATAAGRVVLTRDAWGGLCDVWDADEPVLVIPTTSLLLPIA